MNMDVDRNLLDYSTSVRRDKSSIINASKCKEGAGVEQELISLR